MDKQEASQIINDIKRLVEDIEICIKEHLDLNFEEEEAKEIELYPKSLKQLLAYLKSTNDVLLIKECCNINSRWFHIVKCPQPYYSCLISVTRYLWEIQDYAKEHLWGIPHNDIVSYNFFNGRLYKTLEEGQRELIPLPGKSVKLMENAFEIQASQIVEIPKTQPTNEGLIASLDFPRELNNDKFRWILYAALEKGLYTIEGVICNWKGKKQLLSYFCLRISKTLALPMNYYEEEEITDWKIFAPLFGVTPKQLKGWKDDYTYKGGIDDKVLGKVPKGHEIIDDIFISYNEEFEE